MADTELSRLSRLSAILTILQSKRLITATGIARKFNISVRTVYRDIRALEEAGVPVCTEEGKGYSLMEGYALAPVMFTEMEANALITAEQLVARNKDASFVQHYTEAITKIKAMLKYTDKDKANLLSDRVWFRHNTEEQITSNNLAAIQVAITNFQVMRIHYASIETGDKTHRTIEPLAIYSTNENWLLIAWCRLRKEHRSFRLDGILDMEIRNEIFDPGNFNLQDYFEECRQKYLNTPDI